MRINSGGNDRRFITLGCNTLGRSTLRRAEVVCLAIDIDGEPSTYRDLMSTKKVRIGIHLPSGTFCVAKRGYCSLRSLKSSSVSCGKSPSSMS